MSDVMISTNALTKRFGDVQALDQVDFEVHKGEVVGFLGPNGAGKSTTMRILTCFISPSSGSALVHGFDVFDNPLEVRRKIGYLPQRAPLYPEMNVWEYLEFTSQVRGLDDSTFRSRLKKVVEVCGLAQVLGKDIGTLSHGYRQRVGIAQAIVHRPRFVVLDEPISGLDPVQIVEMRELVRGLSGDHTVVVSSHILHEISETCDRILVIQEGAIRWSGTEADLGAELEKGMRIRLTVRVAGARAEAAVERATGIVRAVPGVRLAEPDDPSETGEGIATVEVLADNDVRDALCRALVGAGVGLLEVSRLRDLETTFRALVGDDDEDARRRGRRRRTESAAPEAVPATSSPSAAETGGDDAS